RQNPQAKPRPAPGLVLILTLRATPQASSSDDPLEQAGGSEERMWVRLSVAAFAAIVVLASHNLLYPRSGGEFLAIAHAQSRAQLKVQKLIDDLRGTSMPKGIAKTNGRIEATQIDIAAKYPGRLASVTVNEGDEVVAGQMIARISSPEYEAQLRGARAQVLKAKQTLAEAAALIVQRKSDLVYAKTDVERGEPLVEKGI